MTRRIWIAWLVLLWSVPALGGDWTVACNSSRTTTAVTPTAFVCYDPTTSSDDSPILSAGMCENTDWHWFADKDGDGTDCDVAWEIQVCPASNLSATEADEGCRIGQGTTALSGTNADETDLGGIFMRLKGDATGSNAADCRIMVKCALRSN